MARRKKSPKLLAAMRRFRARSRGKFAPRSFWLFGRLAPIDRKRTRVDWLRELVYVRDIGPTWEAWFFGLCIGTAFRSRGSAQKGLERFITNTGDRCLDLGWQPKERG